MEHTTIAVDLAKSVFQVAVSHRPGRVDEERRLSRDRFLSSSHNNPGDDRSGAGCYEIAKAVGCVPTKVAAVEAHITRTK